MKADALDLVKRCDKCERHAHVSRKLSVEQTPLVVAWPFNQWGINLLGPFPTTPGQLNTWLSPSNILRSGLKQNRWPLSAPGMFKSLCGKTLSITLAYQRYLCLTMGCNFALIVFDHFVVTFISNKGLPLPNTYKLIGSLKLPTELFWKGKRKDWI